MKKFGFCFLWLLASQGAFAQTPSLSVYFETGKYELAAQEQARLDALMRTLPANAELQLLAYTDDRGDTKTNQVLAHARAGAVSQFLSNQSVALSPQKIQPVGELSLRKDAKMDTEEQRRQNRRVDILVTNFEPKNASEALSYLSRRNTQQFQAPALDRACTFTGKKGTRLSIPANAFALKNADKNNPQPVPPIQIEMREAYSFGDMILQNLSTVSDSQLIQTGGMIYLEAKDALGRGLELAQNKKATWELPNHNPLPEGMQLFTASRQGTDNQSTINWNATGQPFVSTPTDEYQKLKTLKRAIPLTLLDQKPIYTEKDFVPVSIPITPDYQRIAEPVLPNRVDKPNLRLLNMPSFESFKKQHPKGLLESKKNHLTKVQALYKTKQNELNIRNQAINKAYELEYKTYTNYLAEYKAYKNALDTKAKIEQDYFQKSKALDYSLTNNVCPKIEFKPDGVFSKPSDKIKLFVELSQFYNLDSITTKLELLNAKSLEIEKESAIVQAFERYIQSKTAIYKSPLGKFYIAFRSTFLSLSYTHNSNVFYFDFSIETASKWEFQQPNGDIESGLNAYSKTCKKIFGDTTFWAFYKQTARAYQEFAAQDPQEIDQLLKELEIIRKEICKSPAVKAALARAQKKEQLQKSMQTIAQLNGLGWANCDRFATYPDLMHFTINAKSSADAQYFLVMPTEKVVVNLSSNETQVFSPRNYQGLPASKRAKLVGIRVSEEGKTEICEHQGLVSELSDAKLVFRPASLEELPKILAKI